MKRSPLFKQPLRKVRHRKILADGSVVAQNIKVEDDESSNDRRFISPGKRRLFIT